MKRVASTVGLGSSSGGTCSLSPVGVRLVEELVLVVDGLQAYRGKRDGLAFEADDDDRQEEYRDDEEVLLVVGGNTDSWDYLCLNGIRDDFVDTAYF